MIANKIQGIKMADKKRWFWDSTVAEWLESKSFVFAYWVSDKRYFPIQTEDNQWSTVTDEDKSPNNCLLEIVPVQEKPAKKKRPIKKTSAKKPPTKKNWNY